MKKLIALSFCMINSCFAGNFAIWLTQEELYNGPRTSTAADSGQMHEESASCKRQKMEGDEQNLEEVQKSYTQLMQEMRQPNNNVPMLRFQENSDAFEKYFLQLHASIEKTAILPAQVGQLQNQESRKRRSNDDSLSSAPEASDIFERAVKFAKKSSERE